MNSHNPRTESVISAESVKITGDLDEERVIRSNVVEASDLSISEDDDKGSDPYNSTGQHVIIRSKIDVEN